MSEIPPLRRRVPLPAAAKEPKRRFFGALGYLFHPARVVQLIVVPSAPLPLTRQFPERGPAGWRKRAWPKQP